LASSQSNLFNSVWIDAKKKGGVDVRDDQYAGIIDALKMAMYTGQPVNVGLNRHGEDDSVRGVIEKVQSDRFVIQLEPNVMTHLTGVTRETVSINEVEYVNYS
jgi:hypothetical protein